MGLPIAGLFGLLLGYGLLALIPARIAARKGYSFGGYWLFGLFLLVPALTVALLKPDSPSPLGTRPLPEPTKRCPHCLSQIPRQARVCATCRRDVVPPAVPPPPPSLPHQAEPEPELPPELSGKLQRVVHDLVSRYGGSIDAIAIERAVQAQASTYRDGPVTQFLPVLVSRAVEQQILEGRIAHR